MANGVEVGGDGVRRALHEENGIGRVYEIAVASAHKETELLLLLVDEGAGVRLHTPDLPNGL